MNYGETLAYWYLRLNGFFPLRNFVVHRSDEGEQSQSADSDLLAVRFPNVYEEVGGRVNDWDTRWGDWGFFLSTEIIGLIVEVKTSPNPNRSQIKNNSFGRDRIKRAVKRMGMFDEGKVEVVTHMLQEEAVTHGQEPHRIGKLLVSHSKIEDAAWLNVRLKDAEEFIRQRVTNYRDQKFSSRMFFSDELMQYLIWKTPKKKNEKLEKE